MGSTRRDLIKLSALAGMAGLLGTAGQAKAGDGPAPGKKLRILILGGTGFTGPHQVRYALSRGHHVTTFNRGRHPQEWPAEVDERTGDRNTGDLTSLDEGEWDVCIDVPTSLPFWVRDAGRKLAKRVKHYIFISTISVYADNSQPNMDESGALAPYTGKDAMAETQDSLRANIGQLYGPLKALSEKEALTHFKDKVTIVRPGLIVGPGDQTDRFTYWPVRLARGGEVLAPGDGSDPVQFIDARDLAEWIIRLAESRTLGTFNATGPNYELSMAAMLHGIRASTTAGARLTWASLDFLEKNKVSPWGDMPVWVPAVGDSAGFARISIDRALKTGLTFRSLATTTQDTLSWFATQPAERQAKLGAGLTAEREAELLKLWHEAKA